MSEKTRAEQLAIFGGGPAFTEADALHVGRPNVGDRRRLLERIADAVEQRRLTNDGPSVRELEGRLAAALDVHHCVAVATAPSGSRSRRGRFQAAGEVIVPSLTFVAPRTR
jgi:dTDP-4-amino-4,6-dideoxyglucose